jgi:anaerobic dimethyl sulfoxide reductase subunit B (iron-sulfur subunit)
MRQHGFYFDQSRCIGCNACTVACKQWNQLPAGPVKWMRAYQWETGTFPETRVHFLAIPCYHCDNPVCAQACPHGAIAKEELFGAVLIDPEKCRGERRCWKACPYGAIMFATERPGEKASKCTMCIDRLRGGQKPICVLSCSMRAFEFGPVDELRAQFGMLRQLEEMPPGNLTRPSVVFKAPQPKRQIIPWEADKALNLWRDRGPHAPLGASPLFGTKEDLTAVPRRTIRRDRLVLKAKSLEELMYFTTDHD